MQTLRTTVSEDRFLFLKLFTTARDPLPAFVSFLSFLVPLIAIALTFDAVNGESGPAHARYISSSPSIAMRCSWASFWPASLHCRWC
ncbi:MAG: hypothetical protein R2911_20080 [Caldilineaceae bacterium]